MGEQLSKLFVSLETLPGLYALPNDCLQPGTYAFAPSFGGVLQILFLGSAYAFVLFHASNMIADGSELLLLIPEVSGMVGSVVLPILGAIPDGAIVLFSGLGPKEKAQDQLQVGVGALAGSTIMLLTLPWFLSVFAGRVNIVDGKATYVRPPNADRAAWKKFDKDKKGQLMTTGVEPDPRTMSKGTMSMVITTFGYIIIQGSAFSFFGEPVDEIASHESIFALIGLLFCAISFTVYLGISSMSHDENDENRIDQVRMKALKSNLVGMQTAFYEELREAENLDNENTPLKGQNPDGKKSYNRVARNFFNQYDRDNDGSISVFELSSLLKDLGIRFSPQSIGDLMAKIDDNNDNKIQFSEFSAFMKQLIDPSTRKMFECKTPKTTKNVSAKDEGEEEEQEEVPDDLADLPPSEQRKRIIFRSLRLMAMGTLLVLLFSDPMVSVLDELGNVFGIPSFYIAFVLAPLASNASELISAYRYAAKKTQKTITISLSTLEGAAIMNNTFVLGVFLALVYFRGLRWSFSAETISIVSVQLIMGLIARRKVHTLMTSILVLSLFPLSMLLVFFLERVVGLD